jgi:hypothetical protein
MTLCGAQITADHWLMTFQILNMTCQILNMTGQIHKYDWSNS